jgi:hypothetical protein
VEEELLGRLEARLQTIDDVWDDIGIEPPEVTTLLEAGYEAMSDGLAALRGCRPLAAHLSFLTAAWTVVALSASLPMVRAGGC